MFHTEKVSEKYINKDNCPGYYDYVELSDGVNRCVLTDKYVDHFAEEIKNFEVFEDDIWVITFPKCGTTWTQEIVWLLNNNLDYEGAMNTYIDMRFPFIEVGAITKEPRDSLNLCKQLQRPRHIKTHLPKFLLPDQIWTVKPKIIYVTRNPKDAAVSYFHHYRHIIGYTGTKDEFFDAYLAGKLLHSPINENVLEFWKIRHEPNILFLYFEDMKRNLKEEILKMMNFLGKSYSEEQIDKLCEHSSFESMKKNPSCNREQRIKTVKASKNYVSKNEEFTFMREGKIGSHHKEMTEDQKAKFDSYMNYSEFESVGFSYKMN
ncbi:unnamed protein product [Chironomus riparius]|uniref:Sulfotransferase domain-containing protein n=1 Tax=Chironomus riparius TaxID=315576 RepID=A0A9N9RP89_9DIPT|nr:unnamed protein product [Chironomus riparius]